jgi:hypothetical protein
VHWIVHQLFAIAVLPFTVAVPISVPPTALAGASA